MMGRALASCAFLTGLALSQTALAHPLVDEARERFHDADYEGALDAIDRAENVADLDRAGLIEAYELRVLVHLSMGRDRAIERDLQLLLSIDPSHDFEGGAPDDIVQMENRIRDEMPGPIQLSVEAEAGSAGIMLTADLEDDPHEVVREVRISTRTDGGTWSTTAGVAVDVPTAARVEYYAEAIGSGGVVLVSDGTQDAPKVWQDPDAVAPIEEPSPEEDDGGSASLFIGLGIGAAVVVAVLIVVLAVTLSGGSEQTTPTLPMITF